MRNAILAFTSAALLVAGGIFLFLSGCEDDWCAFFEWQKVKIVSSFEQCADFGFPVMESYPRQCRAGEKLFVEEVEDPIFGE